MSDPGDECDCLRCQAERGEITVVFGDWSSPPAFIQELLDELTRDVTEALIRTRPPEHRDFGRLEL
jgi:hypothetical protein